MSGACHRTTPVRYNIFKHFIAIMAWLSAAVFPPNILSHLYACCKALCICQQFLLHSQISLVSTSSSHILHSVVTCSLSVRRFPGHCTPVGLTSIELTTAPAVCGPGSMCLGPAAACLCPSACMFGLQHQQVPSCQQGYIS
jgi:hypothetical protein